MLTYFTSFDSLPTVSKWLEYLRSSAWEDLKSARQAKWVTVGPNGKMVLA
jgi:hypothetical protein